jgi:signal transduction histidine kinase
VRTDAAPTPSSTGTIRRALLGRLEDRRLVRRTRLMHALFIFGLLSWTSLATWWGIYFYRATVQVRDATLRAYAAEVQNNANGLEQMGLPLAEAEKELDGTIYTLAKMPISIGRFPFAELSGPLKGYAVIVRPDEQTRFESNLRRRFIMLAGEGSLLIGLLFVAHFALYRYLMSEIQLRRQQESFVHSVTHELKSPLAGLRALLQSFASLDLPKEERRVYVGMGLTEIDRLDQLVGNILLSSRLEADAFQPQLSPVDLRRTLEQLCERKRLLFQEKGGSLELSTPALTVKADPEALEIILGNLLDNALKYSGASPKVRVKAWGDNETAFVDVTDNGIGLNKADQARVFHKFYRAPSGEEQQAKGSGLGLYLARGLARSTGGDLAVRSEGPGRGCTFTLSQPRAT